MSDVNRPTAIRTLERFIFNVRWVLVPFYIGLIAILAYYGYAFFSEIIHFFVHSVDKNIDHIKIFVLDAVDMVMVANLVKMIITGSYNSFISKEHGYKNENVSSGELKIKICTSVLILSVIHLLKAFVGTDESWEVIEKQLWIFGAIVIAAVVLSFVEFLHAKAEVNKHHD